jgi:hypothetical protein
MSISTYRQIEMHPFPSTKELCNYHMTMSGHLYIYF